MTSKSHGHTSKNGLVHFYYYYHDCHYWFRLVSKRTLKLQLLRTDKHTHNNNLPKIDSHFNSHFNSFVLIRQVYVYEKVIRENCESERDVLNTYIFIPLIDGITPLNALRNK